MYCQACGANNAPDARFCNMCGVGIAPAGAPGGPLAQGVREGTKPLGEAPEGVAPVPAQPTRPARPVTPTPGSGQGVWAELDRGGLSMANVSLAAIGVRSSGQAWGIIVTVVATLLAMGALGMFLAVGGDETGVTEPEEGDMQIGMPLPDGVDAPEVDFVSGGAARPGASKRPRAPSERRGDTQAGTQAAGTQAAGTQAAGTQAAAPEPAKAPAKRRRRRHEHEEVGGLTQGTSGPRRGPGTMAGAGTMTLAGTMAGSGGAGGPTSGSAGSGGSGGSTTGPDPNAGVVPDDMPEERDIAEALYSRRVYYVVSRYYASRAQACFERATRNNPGVRGRVRIAFTIGPGGNVTESRVRQNTTGDEALGRCVAGQVRSWRMPPPAAGSVQMEMPFSN